MANVIGKTQGFTSKGAKAEKVTRLGSEYVTSEANTWETFTEVTTWKDGRVNFTVKRGGKIIVDMSLNAETEAANVLTMDTIPSTKETK